jgi:hypothetical protein
MGEFRICDCNERHQPDSSLTWWVDRVGYCKRTCPNYLAAVEAKRKRNWEETFVPYLEELAGRESLREKYCTYFG